MSELGAAYGVHPTTIRQRRKALLKGAADTFETGKKTIQVDEDTVRNLPAKIGELAVANDYFPKAQALDRQVRRGMIERSHPRLSAGARCRLLSISQPSFYHAPKGETEMNLALMRPNDRHFLEPRSTASNRWPGTCRTRATP